MEYVLKLMIAGLILGSYIFAIGLVDAMTIGLPLSEAKLIRRIWLPTLLAIVTLTWSAYFIGLV